MPHYDYKCLDCGYSFELFQKMNEEPVTFCPSCGGKVKRLIGKGAGPIFKGSGFYQTDYKNGSTKSDLKKKEGKESSEGSEGKSDSPPAKVKDKSNPQE